MLVRNAYTGALHEVPDQQLYEVGEPVFDGFGNPVGGIFDDIVGAVKNVVSAPIQAATSLMNPLNALNPIGAVGNILGNIIPGMGPGHPAAAPALPPAPPPMMGGAMPWQQAGMMQRFHPPFPLGWQHSPLPYTGLGPKRLYMRCAVWPGPSGLVPSYAATMSPQQQQAMMPQGAGAGYGGRRHHGHRGRRR
jgi:hypothetical protein